MAKQKEFTVTMIPADQISYQQDKDFSRFQQLGTDDYIRSVKELSRNIIAIGLLHPITVIQHKPDEYVCSAGNRRLAAMKEVLKYSEIPCVVKSENNFLLSFSEQIMRTDLTEIERGMWIEKAIEHMQELPEFKDSKKPMDDIFKYLSGILGKEVRTLQAWRAMAKNFSPEERARVQAGESAYGIQKGKQAASADKGGRPAKGKKGKKAKKGKGLTPEQVAEKERGKFIKTEANKFIKLAEKIRASLKVIDDNDLEFRNHKQVKGAFIFLQKAMAKAASCFEKKGPVVAIDKS